MSYVYVIGTEDGPVKVGMSDSPQSRLASLQTGSAVKLNLLFARKARDRDHALYHENMFHEVYAEHRMAGEWFDLPADEAIEGVETSFEIEIWHLEEELWEYEAAALNIWSEPDGSHA